MKKVNSIAARRAVRETLKSWRQEQKDNTPISKHLIEMMYDMAMASKKRSY